MIADARHAGRMFRLMGAIFGIVSALLGVGFALASTLRVESTIHLAMAFVAFAVWGYGRWKQARMLDLFRTGDEVRGKVLAVEVDYMQRINKKNPWKVRYAYEVDGTTHEGVTRYWTDQPPEGLEQGREIVVLHEHGNADRSLLWAAATPPIVARDEAATGARIGADVWKANPYAAGAEPPASAAEVEAAAEAEAAAEPRRRSRTREDG